jgi:hypothetical protein
MSNECSTRWMDFMDFLDDIKKPDSSRPAVTILTAVPCGLVAPVSTVYAPLIDPVSFKAEDGSYCTSCLYTTGEFVDPKLFTRESFVNHLMDCRVRPRREYWDVTSEFRLELDLGSSECE